LARIGGVVYLRKNGKLLTLGDGEITCNPGHLKREAVMSSSGVAGFKESPQVSFIEGELIYGRDLDLKELWDTQDETVTAELANGKTFVLMNAYWAGDGDIKSDGKVSFRFEGMRGEFVNG
jgi:hypothetical protein